MQPNRLRELDFLRGIAIILILFRHQYFISYTSRMGWIGVDLFFVLSGFLVSGLLFREFKKFGRINARLFLIRRGLKIYPVYYAAIVVYIIDLAKSSSIDLVLLSSDLTFIQNYKHGFGYLFGPSWSLAVEEHFYFGLVITLGFVLKYNQKAIEVNPKMNHSQVEKWIMAIMILCLALRIMSNLLFPGQLIRNSTMSHLRIDSLLAGVLISYLYHFRFEYFNSVFNKNKLILIILAFSLVSFAPFIDPYENSLPSNFVRTFGFSFLWVAFGILLTFVLLHPNINSYLDRMLGRHTVNMVAKIGVYSYSIYVTHDLVLRVLGNLNLGNRYSTFAICCTCCILVGAMVSISFESFFLKVRDKYFPNRL